jgi:hypothetical protein
MQGDRFAPAVVSRRQESAAESAQRLQAEAQRRAVEHLMELETALEDARVLAAQVATGGDIYPAGIRDFASRLRLTLANQGDTLQALRTRRR